MEKRFAILNVAWKHYVDDAPRKDPTKGPLEWRLNGYLDVENSQNDVAEWIRQYYPLFDKSLRDIYDGKLGITHKTNADVNKLDEDAFNKAQEFALLFKNTVGSKECEKFDDFLEAFRI